MSRRPKDRSYLKYFLVISLAVHLGILFLVPFNPTSVAMKGLIETEGKFYDVEFVQIESEKVTPVGQKEEGVPEIVKAEPEKKPEKRPVEKPPVDEPKPEEDTQGIKGSEEKPVKTEPNLEKVETVTKDPLEQTQSKEVSEQPTKNQLKPEQELKEADQGEEKSEVVEEPSKIEVEPEKTQILEGESVVQSEQILTNEKSEEVIEIEEKPAAESSEPIKAEPSEPLETTPQKDVVASTPEITGQPEDAPEPEKSKEPALPTEAGQMIAQSSRVFYPKAAANEGQEGTVHLLVSVEVTGEISHVGIIQSSTSSILDNNALNTIKLGWKFRAFSTPYTVQMEIEYKAGGTKVTMGELKFSE